MFCAYEALGEFQSALPLRGVTAGDLFVKSYAKFQSALPLRGVTVGGERLSLERYISIRTPLAGSDRCSLKCDTPIKHFNPHSPCGE